MIYDFNVHIRGEVEAENLKDAHWKTIRNIIIQGDSSIKEVKSLDLIIQKPIADE